MVVLGCICNYTCNATHFHRYFKNWTSGNSDIDEFIQNNQRSVHKNNDILQYAVEWIPYDRLYNIKYIVEDVEFGKLYKANWIDGYIQHWSDVNKNWRREGQNMRVFLKILNNSASITSEFINKVKVT
jgi:hypothetical protein